MELHDASIMKEKEVGVTEGEEKTEGISEQIDESAWHCEMLNDHPRNTAFTEV